MIPKPWQRWTILALLLSLSLVSLDRAWSQDKVLTSELRMKRDITFLASDECEGRGPGTKGLDIAADYIVNQFKQAGLKPGGVKGTWFQPFTIGASAAKLDGTNVVKLTGPDKQVIELKLGQDFQVLGNSGSGKISAPLVFVGYGISAGDIKFDDYKDVDVAGKVVVLIRRVPRWNDAKQPFPNKDFHASIENKLAQAEKRKPAAILIVNDASEKNDKLIAFSLWSSLSARSVPFVNISRAALDPVLKSALKKSLAEIEKAIDADLKPLSGPLTGWSATVDTSVTRVGLQVKNVIGVLEGSGPLADETVVVGAHYDHLGMGSFGSRDPKNAGKLLHYGADDNGSGTTSVMELARRFGAMPNRQGRRIVFMTFSAEEKGLLGSRHYCNNDPLFPLEKTVAMVNLDMVGRLAGDVNNKGGKLDVEGVGSGKGFAELVDKFNESTGFELRKKQAATPLSDHDSFYRKKIPIVFFFSGYHKEYHTPKDTADLINVAGMKRIADLAEKVIVHFASDPKRPEFTGTLAKIDPKKDKEPMKSTGPKLGLKPADYEGKDGVKVDFVVDGGVAATAGVKSGDVIVELAGQPVKNVVTYMEIMAKQKVGQTIEIGVLRDGKKITLKAPLK